LPAQRLDLFDIFLKIQFHAREIEQDNFSITNSKQGEPTQGTLPAHLQIFLEISLLTKVTCPTRNASEAMQCSAYWNPSC